MSTQNPEKAPATFADITACFSEEEWKLLHEWQKELYRNVMKEISQALISLGPLIASSIFSVRAEEKEAMFPVDPKDSERRQDMNPSPRPRIANSDVFFTTNLEENQYMKDSRDTDRRKHNDCLSTGRTSFNSDNVLRAEHDFDGSFIDTPDTNRGESSSEPSSGDVAIDTNISFIIKDEEEGDHYSMDHQGCERRENINSPTVAPSFSTESEASVVDDLTAGGRGCSTILSSGNGHRRIYKRSHNDECTETLNPGEALRVMDKVEVLQHSQKRGTRKRPKDSQRNKRNSAKKGSTQSFECETKSENSTEQQSVQTSARRYTCHECGKSFIANSILIIHVRTHTGEKPYSCSECGKCFSQSSNLFTHQRMHTGVKLYTCSECGKCFSKSSNLLQHQQIHTGVKPFHCTECEKGFTRKRYLLRHQRIHTGVKNNVSTLKSELSTLKLRDPL